MGVVHDCETVYFVALFFSSQWGIYCQSSQSITDSSCHGRLQAEGTLTVFNCPTHAQNMAKALPEWFSCGNGRTWRELVKGATSKRKWTAKVAFCSPEEGESQELRTKKAERTKPPSIYTRECLWRVDLDACELCSYNLWIFVLHPIGFLNLDAPDCDWIILPQEISLRWWMP